MKASWTRVTDDRNLPWNMLLSVLIVDESRTNLELILAARGRACRGEIRRIPSLPSDKSVSAFPVGTELAMSNWMNAIWSTTLGKFTEDSPLLETSRTITSLWLIIHVCLLRHTHTQRKPQKRYDRTKGKFRKNAERVPPRGNKPEPTSDRDCLTSKFIAGYTYG